MFSALPKELEVGSCRRGTLSDKGPWQACQSREYPLRCSRMAYTTQREWIQSTYMAACILRPVLNVSRLRTIVMSAALTYAVECEAAGALEEVFFRCLTATTETTLALG